MTVCFACIRLFRTTPLYMYMTLAITRVHSTKHARFSCAFAKTEQKKQEFGQCNRENRDEESGRSGAGGARHGVKRTQTHTCNVSERAWDRDWYRLFCTFALHVHIYVGCALRPIKY